MVVVLYDLKNYSFGTKDAKVPKDVSFEARIARLERSFLEQGCGFACLD